MPLSALEHHAFSIATYMRVTSIAIAGYDYLETQPTAWRFYWEHWRSRRWTISLILFFLLRFMSIAVLTISSVGFFYTSFTQETCGRFYLLPPAFKVVQTMITQAILGVRAFNLSRRSRVVGWILITVYSVACIFQWVTTMYQRTPKVGEPHANCRAVNQAKQLGAYIFYAIAIMYDVLTTTMSIFYLLKYKFTTRNSVMSKLARMMLYDGLGYLVVLTGINVLNLILYKTSADIQTAGASLGYCVSWIMSQRLLIHLYDASRERREAGSFEAAIIMTKDILAAREVSRAVRTFDQKSNMAFDFTRRDSETEEVDYPEEAGVRVRIERTVKTNHYTRTYELEDYSRRTQNR